MQSSRNTTEVPTSDQLYEALNRKLKRASANIKKRKLDTGEYVMHQGRVVPADVVEEFKSEEAHERKIGTSNITRREMTYQSSLQKVNVIVKSSSLEGWIGSEKSLTATLLETNFRRPMHVIGAAPIRQLYSHDLKNNVQISSNDSKSGHIHTDQTREKVGVERRSRLTESQYQYVIYTNAKIK